MFKAGIPFDHIPDDSLFIPGDSFKPFNKRLPSELGLKLNVVVIKGMVGNMMDEKITWDFIRIGGNVLRLKKNIQVSLILNHGLI